MDAFEFQTQTRNFANYPLDLGPYYTILGIYDELGNLSEKLRVSLKDSAGQFTERESQKIMISIGDVMYYLACMCNDMGFNMNDVLDLCLRKQNLIKQKTIDERLDKNNIKHT